MQQPESIEEAITDYRVHFDSIYVAGIPRLLNDDGSFLSFLAVLAATDALAGLFLPAAGTDERFREFVSRYYPQGLREQADRLWKFRNMMVHCFHPGPFALTHHASRAHLTTTGPGVPVLNAQDFYGALLAASRAYFDELASSAHLQSRFAKRISDPEGGAPEAWTVVHARGAT